MEDERGSNPRGASARRRAGEPAAQPTRATGRPPAAIFMEPAIPAPREAEPEPAEQREPKPEPQASPGTGQNARGEPAPAASRAAPPAPAKPAVTPLQPSNATPPAKATPAAKAAPLAKAAPAKAAPVKATKVTKAVAPTKTTAASKAAKATAPAKAAPAEARPAKAAPAKAAVRKATKAAAPANDATKAAKAAGPVLAEPPVDRPDAATPRPEEPRAHEPPTRAPGTDLGPVQSLWDRVRAEPRQAPELLARAAVERYGPEADRYTRWIRATYPAASDDRIAQAAARRFTAQARRATLAAVVGHGAGETAALGWVQARMVLHIAAAYRLDPAAPERVAELLTLMRPARVPVGAGVRAAGRGLATRLVPGAGLLLGALVNDAETGSLARRAISLYRPVPRLP